MATIVSLMILMLALYSYQTLIRDHEEEVDRYGNYNVSRKRKK